MFIKLFKKGLLNYSSVCNKKELRKSRDSGLTKHDNKINVETDNELQQILGTLPSSIPLPLTYEQLLKRQYRETGEESNNILSQKIFRV
jgi:hypothetical protein